jgi:di/tricarboxylate transporter
LTADIAIILSLFVVGMALFVLEWLSFDVVALLLVASLVIFGILTPEEAFSGFASEAIVILGAMFVISGALSRTGLMEGLGVALHRFSAKNDSLLVGSIMGIAATLSAFFSNTTATAAMLPATMEASKQSQISPSRTLMPLAYGSILGGTCTLIGTSTNMASSGLVAKLGLTPFSLFEFTLIGVGLAVVGIVYVSVLGRRLIPIRQPDILIDQYGIQDFLSELIIADPSPAIGQPLGSLDLPSADVVPLAIIRDGKRLSADRRRALFEGDKIIVKASRQALLNAKASKVFGIEADKTLSEQDLSADEILIAEAVVMPRSSLVGKTLKSLEFYRRFGSAVLAIYRRGHGYPAQIENMSLRVGDVLLLQGPKNAVRELGASPDLWGLTAVSQESLGRRKGIYMLLALVAAALAGSAGLIPLSIALLLAALSLVVFQVITIEDAYASIEWRLVMLIAGMTSFGLAMQKTGAADYLGAIIVDVTVPLGISVTLAVFALLTVLLTQPMSNAAAALVMLPIAVATADTMSIDPRTLAVLVTLSASLSFITPLEPASLLVYGPGKYRFVDFIRVGLPLTLICVVVLVVTVPILWPLH